MSKLFITDTILRDAHQSQAATRMKTEDMIPACKILDDIGYWSLECWGGATFDACMRFLNEDPWERLRTLKKHMPKTKLQMLFRGQNILGYKHYADDVVEEFCKKSIENGIDVVRVFDALNDPRNLESSIKFVKEYGGMCEAAISYTVSPVHDIDYFVKLACTLEKMGADTICIKDMANLLLPYDAYKLVKKLKENVGDTDPVSAFHAADSLKHLDRVIDKISSIRSYYGAMQNRLGSAYNNNANYSENISASESRIRDTDMENELVTNSKYNILQQAGEALIAQANQNKQGVLELLQ